MEGDYSERSCLAYALGSLVVVGAGYALGRGFEFVIRLVPTLHLGPVTIPTSYVKYFVVLPVVAILVWRAYPVYVRWLVRVGWLREPKGRRNRSQEE